MLSPSPDDHGLDLLVAAFLTVNRGVPFCAACIAREIGTDEGRTAVAAAHLERSATIRSARFRCMRCSALRKVFVATTPYRRLTV